MPITYSASLAAGGMSYYKNCSDTASGLCEPEPEGSNCTSVARGCLSVWPNDSFRLAICYLDSHCDFRLPRQAPAERRYPLTILFACIFITGVVGNLVTWAVIRSRKGMRDSSVGVYLCHLAVADLITLVSGLPAEVFQLWEQYPWRPWEPLCGGKAWVLETTSYVSVMVITSFCVERYVAICRSLDISSLHTIRTWRRGLLGFIWIIAGVAAVPYGIYTRTHPAHNPWPFTALKGPMVAKLCYLDIQSEEMRLEFTVMMHLSAVVFFLVPLVVLSVLCVSIARSLATSRTLFHDPVRSKLSVASSAFDSRRAVTILMAVVIAFFVCHAPFQLQRLMVVWVSDYRTLRIVDRYLFPVSGVFFYLASTINPILYNLSASRYRKAFMEVLFRRQRPTRMARSLRAEYSSTFHPSPIPKRQLSVRSTRNGHCESHVWD